ncbi:hypothetical protein MPTK1_8g11640 [Marchantia polymorpha subsp. ruderalis]|uniref:Uncharacterized protein n=2 Tax=Marchantia polymorpha TaxID=3197 RepID=A0A176VS98_MARPO|nr:hypothetical protein AXG93_4776s1010 [Marchantia polymorpha subsp. ruderalis]PTQ47272.1 hypothetical protein MARPO_0008s0052 [Marchantia polymorpha]BBN19552.1 hypothetical protein Mp_8g11640 [Marchantia polymorpha subsp. ruderalis]|eukprot:PTQ47272.1 hypothetical protein MARPO_0008s0052 [Marchantia polymorpha]
MDSLKDAAAKVGDKVSNATSTDKSNSAGEGDAHQKTTGFGKSDSVDTAGRPDVTDTYGTHPKEKAASLVSNLEKLGGKPVAN